MANGRKNNLERERKTLRIMLTMYCQGRHGTDAGKFCADCMELWDYAQCRLDRCPFGETKGPCSKCTVHCYKPEMRDRVREVMRYAGPRMLKKHPIEAVRHLIKGWNRSPD